MNKQCQCKTVMNKQCPHEGKRTIAGIFCCGRHISNLKKRKTVPIFPIGQIVYNERVGAWAKKRCLSNG